jgi:hypothetical protein
MGAKIFNLAFGSNFLAIEQTIVRSSVYDAYNSHKAWQVWHDRWDLAGTAIAPRVKIAPLERANFKSAANFP